MDEGDVLDVLLTDIDVIQALKMIVHRSDDEVVYIREKGVCVCLGIKKGPQN